MTTVFAKSGHIVVTLGDDSVIVTPINIPGAAPLCLPADRTKSRQAVVSFLKDHPHAQVTFLLDNLGQDLRVETLPPVGWADRRKLAARRLRHAFPTATLAAYRLSRRDRTLLALMAVHDQNPLHVWLDACAARLPRVALIPSVVEGLAARLAPPGKDWQLILSRDFSGGYRQVVLRKGMAVFARLTPLAAGAEESAAIARDIQASLTYLKRLGLAEAADMAVLLLLDNPDAAVAVRNAVNPGSVLALAPREAAARLNVVLPSESAECPCDALYAALCVCLSWSRFLRSPATRRQWLENVTLTIGRRAATALLVVSLLAVGWQAGGLGTALLALHEQSAALAEAKAKLAQLQHEAGPLTGPLGRLRQAIERKRIFDTSAASPAALLSLVSPCLGEARLLSIDWSASPDGAREEMTVRLSLPPSDSDDGNAVKAAAVAAFNETARQLASCAKGYEAKIIRAPYPNLAGDTVSASETATLPSGEILFTRGAP